MTREDADALAKRIVNCWYGGPPRNEWADYLAGLDDAERAGRVFLQLRTSLEHPPTFKRFSEVYRALAHITPPPAAPEPAGPKPSWDEVKAILRANGAPDHLIARPRLTDAEADRLLDALKENP